MSAISSDGMLRVFDDDLESIAATIDSSSALKFEPVDRLPLPFVDDVEPVGGVVPWNLSALDVAPSTYQAAATGLSQAKTHRQPPARKRISPPPKPTSLATEAEGFVLELAKVPNASGYLHVRWDGECGKFKADHPHFGYLGRFKTAVDAAVALARNKRKRDEAADDLLCTETFDDCGDQQPCLHNVHPSLDDDSLLCNWSDFLRDDIEELCASQTALLMPVLGGSWGEFPTD